MLAALRDGRVRDAAVRAVGYTEELSDALRDTLRDPALTPAARRKTAAAALETSPLLAVRTFTDGRDPTGWDAAYAEVLSDTDADGVATALRSVERTLSPDVWRVDEGLGHLATVVEQRAADPRVAAVVFRTADRIAPFDANRDAVRRIVDTALGADVPDGVRHRYALAALRLRAADRRRRWSGRDGELWAVAERTAPSPVAAELAHLSGLEDRAVHGGEAQAHDALRLLREWAAADGRSDLARRLALPWVARRHAAHGEAAAMLAALDDLARLAEDRRLVGAARCAAVEDLAAAGVALEPEEILAVSAALADSASDLEGTRDAVMLYVARARLATLAGDEDAVLAQLHAASALAAAGAPVEPPRIPRTEWWQAYEPPVDAYLRPVELSRSACWELADRAFRAGRWEQALELLRVDPPGEGCGNVYDDARALQLTRRAQCQERLGRVAEARQTLRTFVRDALSWRSASLALVGLIEFERRHDGLAEHEQWLPDAQLPAETQAKAAAYLAVRRAVDDGRVDQARAAAAEIARRWPEDSVLADRVRAVLPPREGERGDGLGGTPPR